MLCMTTRPPLGTTKPVLTIWGRVTLHVAEPVSFWLVGWEA